MGKILKDPPAGYKFNSNKDLVATIRNGLKAKNGYCPCKVGRKSGNRCICDEMKQKGVCSCGLYVREGN